MNKQQDRIEGCIYVLAALCGLGLAITQCSKQMDCEERGGKAIVGQFQHVICIEKDSIISKQSVDKESRDP